MENHQVQADFSDWDIIRKRIPQQTSRTKKRVWIGSGIAASIALFIISLYLIDQTKETPSFTHDQLPVQQEERIMEEQPTPFIAKQEEKIQEIVFQKQNKSTGLPENNHFLKESNPLITIAQEVKEEQVENPQKNTDTKEENPKNEKTKEQTSNLYQQKNTHTPVIKSKKTSKKNKRKWVLASSFGTNNAIPTPDNFQYDLNYSTPPPKDIWAGWGGGYYPNNVETDLLDNSVDATHLPPFSFGLTLRKSLNQRLAIETGLIYTYLSSTYKWHEKKNRESIQQLHYLGIPVNSVITVWDNSRWSNYISAGFMMEKGLRRKISKDDPQTIFPSDDSQRKTIDGLQWSVGASIGFNYHFTKKVSLYVEPRINYYFKNNQPRSIRTDSPVSAGFGMGIQYSL